MNGNPNQVLSLLGLAARAGKIVSGEEMVIKGIQRDKIIFVILAEDSGENNKKRISDKSAYYQIPYRVAFTKDQLGNAIGKSSRVVIGITDEGFSKKLEKLLE